MPVNEKYRNAFRLCAVITTISAFVSASFSVAALFGSDAHNTYTLYAASRSVALPLVVIAVLWLRSRAGLATMAFTMALVQTFDVIVGILARDAGKTYGPLVLALAGFASVASMLRHAENK